MKRLVDMTPEERGAWLTRLGARLRQLVVERERTAREVEEIRQQLREAEARLGEANEGIEHVRVALQDFDPKELVAVGIRLPESNRCDC